VSTALVIVRPTHHDPDLVAWWTGNGFTCWHIVAGDRTRCGRLIPTVQGSRLTRRHHPAADVCAHCLKPDNKNSAREGCKP